MCLLSLKVVFQESFRSLYKELFGENVYKKVKEELNENCILHKRLYKLIIIVSSAPPLKFIFCYQPQRWGGSSLK